MSHFVPLRRLLDQCQPPNGASQGVPGFVPPSLPWPQDLSVEGMEWLQDSGGQEGGGGQGEGEGRSRSTRHQVSRAPPGGPDFSSRSPLSSVALYRPALPSFSSRGDGSRAEWLWFSVPYSSFFLAALEPGRHVITAPLWTAPCRVPWVWRRMVPSQGRTLPTVGCFGKQLGATRMILI